MEAMLPSAVLFSLHAYSFIFSQLMQVADLIARQLSTATRALTLPQLQTPRPAILRLMGEWQLCVNSLPNEQARKSSTAGIVPALKSIVI